MANSFLERGDCEFPMITCVAGKAVTIRHGFVGKGLLPPALELSNARSIISSYLSVPNVVLPVQTHGDGVVNVDQSSTVGECEGDAIISTYATSAPVALCIRTADCVPIIALGESKIGLIHAGWRGLANGIVTKVLSELLKTERSLQVVIGPCAGSSVYEVGGEVLDAIGTCAVSHPLEGTSGKRLLDLEGTTRAIIGELESPIEIYSSGICTMSDDRFYSFRRDGDRSGRNLTFAIAE